MTSNPCFDFFPSRVAFSSFEYRKKAAPMEREREGRGGGGWEGGRVK